MLAGFRWIVLWLLLAATVVARDVHVNNLAGDDCADGGALQTVVGKSGPVRSIAKALRLAKAGDHIVVANTGQPYRESLSLTSSKHSGSPVSPFIIEGNGAVLEGATNVPDGAWQHHHDDVFFFQPTGLGYQQLFLEGRPAIRRPTTHADVSLPPLEPREWCFARGKIFFRVEKGGLPEDYSLGYCRLRTGITLYHVRDVIIKDLFVQGFQFDGIAASDGVRGARIQGVTCRGNGRSGISVSGASIVEITGCLLGANGDSQLRSEDFGQTFVRESELIADTAPAITAVGGNVRIDGKPLR
jgi:hypothetical protein